MAVTWPRPTPTGWFTCCALSTAPNEEIVMRFIRPLCLVSAISLFTPGLAWGQFADLLKRVPSDANGILLIDAQAIQSSPIGRKENWTARHKQDYLAGVGAIPPNVKQIVIAAQVNTTTLHDNWKISIAKLNQEVTLGQLTTDHPGSLDNVAGQAVVLGPRSRTYYVPFAPTVTGTLTSSNCQQLAHWIRFVKQDQNIAISPYLHEGVS